MSVFERMKQQDAEQKAAREKLKNEKEQQKAPKGRNNSQGNIKLEKEYRARLNDGKVHSIVPVQSYSNGNFYGIVVDQNRYALISAEKFNKLINNNKELNRDVDDRDAHFERAGHDQTVNKQDSRAHQKDQLQYYSLTIYDISDNGDASDSRSISVYMDKSGNMFNSSGSRVYRATEELKLDLENDTGKFYADWMDAQGTPIDKNDMLERGIDPDIIDDMYQLSASTVAALEALENEREQSLMKEMQENARENPEQFTTTNYDDPAQAIDEMYQDERYES